MYAVGRLQEVHQQKVDEDDPSELMDSVQQAYVLQQIKRQLTSEHLKQNKTHYSDSQNHSYQSSK